MRTPERKARRSPVDLWQRARPASRSTLLEIREEATEKKDRVEDPAESLEDAPGRISALSGCKKLGFSEFELPHSTKSFLSSSIIHITGIQGCIIPESALVFCEPGEG